MLWGYRALRNSVEFHHEKDVKIIVLRVEVGTVELDIILGQTCPNVAFGGSIGFFN
jgi:hypothetical protein